MLSFAYFLFVAIFKIYFCDENFIFYSPFFFLFKVTQFFRIIVVFFYLYAPCSCMHFEDIEFVHFLRRRIFGFSRMFSSCGSMQWHRYIHYQYKCTYTNTFLYGEDCSVRNWRFSSLWTANQRGFRQLNFNRDI